MSIRTVSINAAAFALRPLQSIRAANRGWFFSRLQDVKETCFYGCPVHEDCKEVSKIEEKNIFVRIANSSIDSSWNSTLGLMEEIIVFKASDLV